MIVQKEISMTSRLSSKLMIALVLGLGGSTSIGCGFGGRRTRAGSASLHDEVTGPFALHDVEDGEEAENEDSHVQEPRTR